MLKALLIGAGFIGKVHAECLAQSARAHLGFVVDTDVRRAAALGAAASSATLDDGLSAGCDFAIIATPTEAHGPVARACIAANLPFLCEKPIDVDLDSAVETARAAKTAGLRTGLAFNRRHDAQYLALKAHVAAGDVGTVETMVLTSRTQSAPAAGYIAASGGMMRDKGAHFFDLACWLSGSRPAEVFAQGACLFEPGYARHGDVDTAVLSLRMQSGAFCQMNFSRRTGYGYDERIEIAGSAGMVQARIPVAVDVALYKGAHVVSGGGHAHWYDRVRATYPAQLAAYLDHLETGAAFPSVQDGLVAEAVARAAERSMRTGAAEPVDYALADAV
ncbi:MAG: Gfo/Idh/MocA family oxidoreductase [Rhodobacter sp.]|nr:Gfo/Idh/MocA family oxidoreductase [Rhodobacter sp.]